MGANALRVYTHSAPLIRCVAGNFSPIDVFLVEEMRRSGIGCKEEDVAAAVVANEEEG
jgi:hypothetical protein